MATSIANSPPGLDGEDRIKNYSSPPGLDGEDRIKNYFRVRTQPERNLLFQIRHAITSKSDTKSNAANSIEVQI